MVLVLALALVLLVLVVVAVVVMIRPWFSYPGRCSTEFPEFCGRLAA